jgi:hypothetical protein
MTINKKPTFLLDVMPYSLEDSVREDLAAVIFRVETVNEVVKMVCDRGCGMSVFVFVDTH